MRLIILLSFIWTNILLGQPPTKKQADSYIKTVDSLRTSKKLKISRYTNMSLCGGALYGYYFNDQLMYIEATFNGELGFTKKTLYLKDTMFYKIIFQEHFPEWDKYYKKYPQDTTGEIDTNKMTYSDTLYTIVLTEIPIYIKTSKKKLISRNADIALINNLVACGRRMKRELESEKIPN